MAWIADDCKMIARSESALSLPARLKLVEGPLFLHLIGGSTTLRQAQHEREGIVMPEKIIVRSEEHTSELQSLMRISYAVFCLKKKKKKKHRTNIPTIQSIHVDKISRSTHRTHNHN